MPAKDNGKDRTRERAGRGGSPTATTIGAVTEAAPPEGGALAEDAHVATAAADPPPFAARPVADRVLERFSAAADEPGVGGAFRPDPATAGAIGFTHFDSPASEDDAVAVLMPKESMARLPAQALVRIVSPRDPADRGATDATNSADVRVNPTAPPASTPPPPRVYLGVVVAGPFAEPDGLRADSSLVVATTVSRHGGVLLPRYHGRALVEILGEIDPAADLADSGDPADSADPTDTTDAVDPEDPAAAARPAAPRVFPPRHRPRPNSPVFALGDADTAAFLRCGGGRPADARLGVLVGRDRLPVSLPTDAKHVLPRHTGVLGTTGGGKSTTVATLVHQLQAAGVATVVIDVEGEYTEIDRPADDPSMRAALRRRGLAPAGVRDLHVLHPVGRETSREVSDAAAPRRTHPFALRFAELSPYAVTELLEMPDPQQERFLKCFDVTRQVLKDLGIFPARGNRDEDDQLAALDELETGYPRMTLSHLIDVASLFAHQVAKDEGDVPLFNEALAAHAGQVKQRVAQVKSSHEFSWRGLIGRLHRVNRLRIFDNPNAPPLRYAGFLEPGRVSVVDLSDTDEPQVRNLVIADVLRGIQREQERAVAAAQAEGRRPTPVVGVIEEAHEFLSAQRVRQMPTLFQQVARIARRGRKRWLGLVFVTQLPQHLPDEVLGLINNWVLHRVTDAGVIDRLRKSIGGLDRGQWNQAPGQAVVSLTSWARPLVVSVDPAPCRLRLVD